MKVLLVDDNNFSLKLLQKRVEESGFEVATALDGIKALNAVRTDPPDLILLDIMMPRLDGYRVCKLLRVEAGAVKKGEIRAALCNLLHMFM